MSHTRLNYSVSICFQNGGGVTFIDDCNMQLYDENDDVIESEFIELKDMIKLAAFFNNVADRIRRCGLGGD